MGDCCYGVLYGSVDRQEKGEKKSSWRCKFDPSDPNVWLQFVLVLLVLGFGTSTVVLATNQNTPPPSPPPPPPLQPPPPPPPAIDGILCSEWSAMQLAGWTVKTSNAMYDNMVPAYCVFPISDSTIAAMNEYTKFSEEAVFICYHPQNTVNVQMYANLQAAYNQVTAAFAADGFVIQGRDITLLLPEQNAGCWIGEWFKGELLTPGDSTTLAYKGHPIAMQSGQEAFVFRMSISMYNKMAMLTVVETSIRGNDERRYVNV